MGDVALSSDKIGMNENKTDEKFINLMNTLEESNQNTKKIFLDKLSATFQHLKTEIATIDGKINKQWDGLTLD